MWTSQSVQFVVGETDFALGLLVGSEHVSEEDGVTECVCLGFSPGRLAGVLHHSPSLPIFCIRERNRLSRPQPSSRTNLTVAEISELLD